jgi:hypothetical protein
MGNVVTELLQALPASESGIDDALLDRARAAALLAARSDVLEIRLFGSLARGNAAPTFASGNGVAVSSTIPEVVAIVCPGTFAGAAVCITLAQHPAAMALGTPTAVRFLRPMHGRAAPTSRVRRVPFHAMLWS